MKDEKLVENSANLGAKWKKDISSIDSPEIVDVRGYGMIIGIEMKSQANDFRVHCLENGILVNVCHGNVVRLIPPLIINEEQCNRFTDILKDYLNA